MGLPQVKNPPKILSPKTNDWSFSDLTGRVVELSGWNHSACLTLAASLIRECQNDKRLCAWVVPGSDGMESLFFPPDFTEFGIKCALIPILRSRSNADGFGLAEKLLRSGGFGLIVIDLTSGRSLKSRVVGRVHVLARKFGSLVLCLTRSPSGSSSLDPMVFTHAHIDARQYSEGGIRVVCHVQKDKAHSPSSPMEWFYDTPPGMR